VRRIGSIVAGALVVFGVLSAFAHVWAAFASCAFLFCVTIVLLAFANEERLGSPGGDGALGDRSD
jgi:hypothetical protein